MAHRGPGANEDPRGYPHPSQENGSRSDVAAGTDNDVVLNHGPRVYEDIVGKFSTGLHHSARHDLHARAQHRIRRDRRGRMHNTERRTADIVQPPPESRTQIASGLQCHTDGKQRRFWIVSCKKVFFVVIVHQSPGRRPFEIGRIDDTRDRHFGSLEGMDQDAAVPSPAEDIDRKAHCSIGSPAS